ncbi:MAG: hypothetical protein ACYTAN_14555 [Planctomycetota bacterium]|jgi:hypothetical protein
MAEAWHEYRIWRRVNDGPWTLPSVRVFESMEAAEAEASDIAGQVRILPADVGPVMMDVASAQALKQGNET